MDFNFTEEQSMLRDTVASFLNDKYDFEARKGIVKSEAGWRPDYWKAFAEELGILGACLGRRGVGEGVDGAAGELPRDVEDDAGNEDSGDGVGEFERGNVPVLAGVGRGQAEEDGERGPDVSAEVDSVGF